MTHAAALVLGAALLLQAGSAEARPATDGDWSIQASTEQGSCSKVSHYPVVIENSRPRSGSQSLTVSGQVTHNGVVSAVISHFVGSAQVRGRLAGHVGTGTWTTAALGGCSGRWIARKRA